MKVICKNTKNDPNITVNKTYTVLKIESFSHTPQTNLRMFMIKGDNNTICYYWIDYFNSLQETRKLKLLKIYE